MPAPRGNQQKCSSPSKVSGFARQHHEGVVAIAAVPLLGLERQRRRLLLRRVRRNLQGKHWRGASKQTELAYMQGSPAALCGKRTAGLLGSTSEADEGT